MGQVGSCLGKGCSTLFYLWALWVAGGIVVSTYKGCQSEEERQARMEKDLRKELEGCDNVIVENGKIILIDEVRPKKTTGDISQSKSGVSGPRTPTGSFTINFEATSGPNKQFQFTIGQRDKDGTIKMKVKEFGGKYTSIGGMARFNVVFWDPAHPEYKGATFQLCLNESQGAMVRPYDPALTTIYMGNNEKVCGRLHKDYRVTFQCKEVNFKGTQPLRHLDLELPEKFCTIGANIQKSHDTAGKPIVIPDRATRERAAQKKSR